MSWFETKSFSTYAKSALLQAQKKIDQVLDIKEEEIIGLNTASTKPVQKESDSFFSPFLNPEQAKPKIDESTSQENTDANSSVPSRLTANESSTNSLTCESFSTTPTISFVENNLSEVDLEPAELDEKKNESRSDSTAKTKRAGRSSRTLAAANLTNNSKAKSVKQHELEKIEKQNRVKNYVNTDGGNSSHTNPEDNLETSDQVNSFYKDDMLVSINSIPTMLDEVLAKNEDHKPLSDDNDLIDSNKEEFKIVESTHEAGLGAAGVPSPTSTSSNISVDYEPGRLIDMSKTNTTKHKKLNNSMDFVNLFSKKFILFEK